MSSRLPDFLVIGAMKAGTTTLCSDLGGQPAIFMPPLKEPEDLLHESVRTESGRKRYARLFIDAKPHQLCGEGSTSYAKLPTFCGVAERAKEVLGPNARIIYSVRNPVERLISHYLHLVARMGVVGDIDTVIRSNHSLLDFSRYDIQLEPWLQNFGYDAIHLIRFEDFVCHRGATLAAVCQFLGCDANLELLDESQKRNVQAKQPVYSAFTERFITSQFYWRTLRPILSAATRERFRRLLGRKPRAGLTLPSETMLDYVIGELHPSVERLSKLWGLKEPLWDLKETRDKYMDLIKQSKENAVDCETAEP